MQPTDLAVDLLATARLTRLATTDLFPPVAKLRDRVFDRYPPASCLADGTVVEGHFIGELLSCNWCTSVWVGAGVVAARMIAPRLWSPVAKLLAASEVAGILADRS